EGPRGLRRAAVRGGDLGRDGQAEAGAPGPLAPAPVEALEDVRQRLRRDPGAVVADLDGDAVARGRRGDRAGGPGGGVYEHVHQQVVDGAAEQFLVADGAQVVADADSPGPFGVGDPGPLGTARDHGGQVDRLGGPAG